MRYAIGTRIALHPATDHWMRGDRYGLIVGHVWNMSRKVAPLYKVQLDVSGKVVRLAESNVLEAVERA